MYAVTKNISEKLAEARYHVRTGEKLNAAPICFVASKIRFVPKYIPLGLLSTHIVVLEKDEAKSSDMQELFDTGFKLAKRINRIPLLRGMQFGYAILPLIIGRNPDSGLLLYAASSPRLRFSLVPFPIVVDLTDCQVAFYQEWRTGGGMFWPMLQEIVTKHIEPLVDEGCSGEG